MRNPVYHQSISFESENGSIHLEEDGNRWVMQGRQVLEIGIITMEVDMKNRQIRWLLEGKETAKINFEQEE